MGTGQLVPKSTRTLVNSYPFLVNSYLSQLVPTARTFSPKRRKSPNREILSRSGVGQLGN